ncbi:hypothetical protein [Paenibacillus cremeus]|uniref:Uncharacterized protein n=1 Tax=Paenibacillus cremeus TaxID=2163881 RepID=A0A559JM93_9BACL|nr:hypothetical protein [Paenibacillus cremeus]TVY00994.1 hypothetical protein FPZ49_32905 [Paenibacillus cremeus]
MKYLLFAGLLVLGYFSFPWAWIALLAILGIFAFIAWFQAFVWKRRITMYGYTKNPYLSDEANELYSSYPQFYDSPFAAKSIVETSGLLWVAGLVLAVWGAFYTYWIGLAFFVIGFVLATITNGYFKPRSNKTNLQELHEEIMAYKFKAYAHQAVSDRKQSH